MSDYSDLLVRAERACGDLGFKLLPRHANDTSHWVACTEHGPSNRGFGFGQTKAIALANLLKDLGEDA